MFNPILNSERFSQLMAVLKNTRSHYRNALCGFKLHPAVYDISSQYNPLDWHNLILELPKIASDGISIAYYRKDSDVNVKATVAKLGKYIKRHFPDVKDNIIRDIVSKYNTTGKIITDLSTIVDLIENAGGENHPNFPTSCMTNEFSVHPYRVYDPKFGWALAVKTTDKGQIIGRALVLENDTHKCYVRAFTSSVNSDSGFTIDSQLETWLDGQGYEYKSSWPTGAKLAKLTYRGKIVAPYIDGNNDNCNDMGDYLTICNDGKLECSNTSGYAEEKSKHTCSHCGDRVSADETTYIEGFDDVCENCLESDFTYISERRVSGRYVGGNYYHNNDVIETIEGDSFPRHELLDFDIVELHNGDYTHLDNACMDYDSDEYYHTDDIGTEIFYCEDDNEYHSESYWQCAGSNLYYSNDIESIELDGELYNPENVKDKDTLELF